MSTKDFNEAMEDIPLDNYKKEDIDYVKKYVESTLGPDLNYELDFIKVCALA